MKIQIDENDLPILSQFSEEDFIDCVFEIQNIVLTGSHINFHLAASHQNNIVGMDVEIVRGIKAGFDHDMNLHSEHVYRNGVKFSRSGPESDRLMQTLAELYGLERTEFSMVAAESFTAIALHHDPVDPENEPVKLKIFGKDGNENSEEEYFESFFNLDLPNGLVFWNEKDPGYRQSLINGLTIIAV